MNVARPAGIAALSAFFAFGMTMSGLAAVSLSWPGSALEPIWQINPRGHEGLAGLGWLAVILMAAISLACAATAAGLWLGRRWAWWLAIAILIVNATADLLNGVLGSDARTLIGVPFAAAILYYLGTTRVRAYFDERR